MVIVFASLLALAAGAQAGTPSSSPAPSPTATALKTIVTVRSSAFCATLGQRVAPALAGLMRNDQLIALGRSANVAMNNEVTYGGAHVNAFVQRERQIAQALEHNVVTVENILADRTRFPEHPANDDQATLASIKSQLSVVVREQRALINFLNGEAETQALDQLNDADPSIASSSLGGLSPLQAQEATHDPALAIQAQAVPGYTSYGDSVYGKFARVMDVGRSYIAVSENAAAQTILANVPACAPQH